jgi:hypothetical protein
MTASAAPGGRRRGLGVALAVAVVAGLLLAGSLTGEGGGTRPYDPASTALTGTHALVELIESFGSRVDVPDRFPVDADVAVVFQDVIPDDLTDDVEDWVAKGHTLVIGDPRAESAPPAELLNPAAAAALGGGPLPRGRCTVDPLADARELDLSDVTVAAAYLDDGVADVCFATGRHAFVRVEDVGAGHVVGLAGAGVLQNRSLGRADNAVLAMDLIAPRRGTRVAVLTAGAFPTSGRQGEVGSLGDLLTAPVRLLLAELAVAAVVFALASGRRLGRPMVEAQPVQIAGSELVAAVGDLLRQQRDPDRTASILRGDLRRTLAQRTGLPPDAPPAAVAEAVAARTGRPVEEVRALLTDFPVGGDAELVRLADQIDTVREEVLHGRTP